jgi:phospholipase C
LIRPWEGWLNDDFHDALCCGLWDADKKAPYNNPVLEVVPTWKSHFYDPDTQTNWLGEFQPTAVSEGITYYREAQRAFRREHWQEAGHKLGVALHYLTDLTQPMHAANFTWLDSLSFGYHTDFERYVKNMLPRIKPPKVYAPRLNETRYKRYFHAVARYSKDTYFALLCKPEWTQHYTNEARAEKVWDARVGTLVPHILSDAVQMTAQFLLLWFTEALTSPQH